MTLTDLQPFKLEHKDLLKALEKATKIGGKTAEAAKAALEILRRNYRREEEYILPLLAILPALANGQPHPDMEKVIPLIDKLKAEFPQITKEHSATLKALRKLIDAANAQKKREIARVAERLLVHARMEEEFFYPAAVSVGELLKSKLSGGKNSKRSEKSWL